MPFVVSLRSYRFRRNGHVFIAGSERDRPAPSRPWGGAHCPNIPSLRWKMTPVSRSFYIPKRALKCSYRQKYHFWPMQVTRPNRSTGVSLLGPGDRGRKRSGADPDGGGEQKYFSADPSIYLKQISRFWTRCPPPSNIWPGSGTKIDLQVRYFSNGM